MAKSKSASPATRALEDAEAAGYPGPIPQDLFLAVEQVDHEMLIQLRDHVEAELKSRQERAYEENRDRILGLFRQLTEADRVRMVGEVVRQLLGAERLTELALDLVDALTPERLEAFLLALASHRQIDLSVGSPDAGAEPQEPPRRRRRSRPAPDAADGAEPGESGATGRKRGILGIYVNRDNPDEFKKSPRTPNHLGHVPAESWQYVKVTELSPEQRQKYGV